MLGMLKAILSMMYQSLLQDGMDVDVVVSLRAGYYAITALKGTTPSVTTQGTATMRFKSADLTAV
jgi:hypothetical protein